jgi:hypothetical protein
VRSTPEMQNVAAVSELLKPFDAQQMRGVPVSTRINSVEKQALIARYEPSSWQSLLLF